MLTDRARRPGLADLTLVPTPPTPVNRTDAGHVDFAAPLGDHPLEKGLVGAPSQTYYEVMLGFPSRGRAPNFGVVRTAWEAAGGITVATVGAQGASTSPNTALGILPLGAGRLDDLRRAAPAGRSNSWSARTAPSSRPRTRSASPPTPSPSPAVRSWTTSSPSDGPGGPCRSSPRPGSRDLALPLR